MMTKNKIKAVVLHLVLAILAIIWITPIVWLIVTSFSGYDGMNTSRFFRKHGRSETIPEYYSSRIRCHSSRCGLKIP